MRKGILFCSGGKNIIAAHRCCYINVRETLVTVNVDSGDLHLFFCLSVDKSLLRRCIKRELLQDITTLQLTRLDVADKNNWLHPQDIDIGLGAESILKVV